MIALNVALLSYPLACVFSESENSGLLLCISSDLLRLYEIM